MILIQELNQGNERCWRVTNLSLLCIFAAKKIVNDCVIQPVLTLHRLPETAKKERNSYDDIATIFCGAIHNLHQCQLVSGRFE